MSQYLVIIIFIMLISGCASTTKVVQTISCSDIQSCSESIMLRIRKESQSLCNNMTTDKFIVVISTFSRAGDILDINLITSSGIAEFDNIAMDSIKATAPFVELSMLNDADFVEASVINFKFEGNKDG
jgi:hypothetical protein